MILLALLLVAAPAPPAAPPSRLDADAAAVARAGAALDPHLGDRASFDGKPGTDRLIAAQEQAVQRWVASWLDLHPGATIAALTEAGKRLGKGWSIAGTDLGRGDLLITVSRSWMSDIFIVGRDARGVHRLRWALSAPQRRLDRKADFSLSQWRPAMQNSNCPHCALMSGPDSGRLPDAADGTARFWIEASYAQEMGATMGAQLSLWSWRHGAARPLLVHDLVIMAEQHGPTLRGTTLHVPSKGEWHSLYACGSCFGRVIDLRFAVGPGRVRMLPPVSETPELDLIDRVYARVLARRPVGALAAPSALRIIRAQQRDNLAERDPQLRKLTGMVSGWYRWRSHGRRWLCLADDGTDPMAFAFDASLRRITDVHVLGLPCRRSSRSATWPQHPRRPVPRRAGHARPPHARPRPPGDVVGGGRTGADPSGRTMDRGQRMVARRGTGNIAADGVTGKKDAGSPTRPSPDELVVRIFPFTWRSG